MKAIALTAIFLWVITVAVLGWFFVNGSTERGSDGRMAVLLSDSERGLVLAEMCGLLSGTQSILDGVVRSDMKQVAQAARAVGMASAADVNPALRTKLPLAFKELGMSVHHDMDALAQAADSGQPPKELLTMLSTTMAKCVACHSAWQLPAAPAR